MSIVGPFNQVELALAAVPDRGEPTLKSREILFSLDVEDLVIPAKLTNKDCFYRTITSADLDLITDWRIDYEVTILNIPPSSICREKTRDKFLSQRWWILEAEGRPVSMTTFTCLIPEAAVVGGVYTPPDLRGKGFARAVVAGSILDVQKEGVAKVILFTGEDNFPAQRAYRSLGFRECGDFGLVVWG
jgi:RimJ/RimL family protein N-acetyltransferase